MNDIRWLTDLTRSDLPIAGGKGANLGELTRAGFAVPEGFVVTTAAYDRFVTEHGLAQALADAAAAVTAAQPADAAAARVAGLFAEGELPADLADAIRRAYAQLGGGPVAVRSSATAEDLAEASFAGQQDTYLNVVGEDALLQAVRDCWGSLWTDRAIWYRAEHPAAGSGHGNAQDVSLAVVVQRLVPAVAAGVMFTANPANGRTEETVITAAWGLGEAVVSGLVDTDTIVVDTEAGRVLNSLIADKAVRIDPIADSGDERTRTRQTSQDERHAAVLDEADALRLAGVGAAIERHFGAPQDIEWVLAGGEFSIVQSRPITALPPRIGPVPDEWPMPAKGLYFRASITEQLPDPLSPLFADLMATAVPASLNRLMGELWADSDLDIDFPTINGYAFYRYGYSAFGTMLGGTPHAFRVLLGDSGRWVESRWRDRVLAEYRAAVDAQQARDPGTLPAAELLDAVAGLVQEVAYYYTGVQTIIPLAAIAELSWTGVYDKLLKRDGDPSAETFLLGYDSEPIRAEKDLFDLAGWVREQPGLVEALAADGVDPSAGEPPVGVDEATWAGWRERFGAHLAAHGHTLYNLDFVNPVPADDPAPVLQALRFYLTAGAGDPHVRQQRMAAERENASAALLVRLSGWRQQGTRQLLGWAQRLGPLREDALAAMGLAWPVTRRLLREFGARAVKAGALDEPLDVCWLTLEDSRRLAASLDGGDELPGDLRARIAQRRAEARGQRQARPPQYLPKSRLMDAFEWMYPAREGQQGDVLTGTAGSGGIVTARARVLNGPEDFASFQSGEVLVASITTPAYTPLFAMAAAVVTDIGGVLSHGSIVAREYGIPAVLGTGSATRAIHTGDEITVDGTKGEVHLLGAKTPEPAPAEELKPVRTWLLVAGGAALVLATIAYFRRRR